jgi:hypothetical protein
MVLSLSLGIIMMTLTKEIKDGITHHKEAETKVIKDGTIPIKTQTTTQMPMAIEDVLHLHLRNHAGEM